MNFQGVTPLHASSPSNRSLKKKSHRSGTGFPWQRRKSGYLPQLVYHQDDAPNPYVTAAIIVARDPQTGKSNLSFHRLMIMNENTTSIFMARGKHLDLIYRKYESAGEPMPITRVYRSASCLFSGSGVHRTGGRGRV